MNNLAGDFITVESIFYDIILNEMADVVDPQNIWIANQNKKIPNDADKLFIVIGMQDAVTISNKNNAYDIDGVFTEVQEVNKRENIQIDLISRDNKARDNRHRIEMAMKSIFSQQQQELYSFKIFRIPNSLVNTSEAEGSGQINRFSIVIPCHVWYRNSKVISSTGYYDTFKTRVDDEATAGEIEGLIEFEIKEGA